MFRNRQMPRRWPDYGEYLRRLDLDIDTDPFEVMARSEGIRMTDRVEVFSYPERTPGGGLTTLFFGRGIRHLPGAAEAVTDVMAGDVLVLADEPDNPPTAPPHMRLLCRLRAPWPDGYEPLAAPEFQPIAT